MVSIEFIRGQIDFMTSILQPQNSILGHTIRHSNLGHESGLWIHSFNIRMFIDGIQMGQYMSSETNNVIDAEAHCDGPCGVYDPASARIAG
ncbi:MAG: superoxide dismutase [Ni], partial [Candidatus Poseidoniales archaeon]